MCQIVPTKKSPTDIATDRASAVHFSYTYIPIRLINIPKHSHMTATYKMLFIFSPFIVKLNIISVYKVVLAVSSGRIKKNEKAILILPPRNFVS